MPAFAFTVILSAVSWPWWYQKRSFSVLVPKGNLSAFAFEFEDPLPVPPEAERVELVVLFLAFEGVFISEVQLIQAIMLRQRINRFCLNGTLFINVLSVKVLTDFRWGNLRVLLCREGPQKNRKNRCKCTKLLDFLILFKSRTLPQNKGY